MKWTKRSGSYWNCHDEYGIWGLRQTGKGQFLGTFTRKLEGTVMVGITLGNLTEAKQATKHTRQRWIEANEIQKQAA